MMFQFNPFQQLESVLGYWDHFLSGFLLTMWIYIWALLFGFILGLFLAILRVYGGFIFSKIATSYIEIIRGTPLLAQLFFIFFLPYAFNIVPHFMTFETNFYLFNKEITLKLLNYQMFIGILTLSLNSGAYQAEYIRGAIASVGTGQIEAAQSLGMSRLSSIRHIIFPQALRRVIPSWSNEAAYLPKYTVLVYFIGGVEEIFFQADFVQHKTFFPLTTYIIAALMFLITISLISKLLEFIYNRIRVPGL